MRRIVIVRDFFSQPPTLRGVVKGLFCEGLVFLFLFFGIFFLRGIPSEDLLLTFLEGDFLWQFTRGLAAGTRRLMALMAGTYRVYLFLIVLVDLG